MRRLNFGQSVSVEVDDAESIECTVTQIEGQMATFKHAPVRDARLTARLADWSLSYVMFVHQSSPVALRGVVRASPDRPRMLQFVVIDGVQMQERRRQARVAVAVPVTVSPSAAPSAVEELHTQTVDLSPGGLLLKAGPGLSVGDPVDVTVQIPWFSTELQARAQVLRRTPSGVALAFTTMSEDHEANLAAFIEAAQFALAPSPS